MGLFRLGGDDPPLRRRENLPGYAAVDRGRVFGYSFFVYEGSKGMIGDLYVINGTRLPDARQVELKLLTHVTKSTSGSGAIQLYSPWGPAM